MLQALGLDETSEGVYRAMLEEPHSNLAGIGERLNISEIVLRQALDRLHELALVRRPAGEPGLYRAVAPDIGVQLLLARQQECFAQEQQRIEQSRISAAQLIADFAARRHADPYESVKQLHGLDEIRDRIHVLCANVTTEVMTFVPGPRREVGMTVS
jgi:predicted transcriptional regulator